MVQGFQLIAGFTVPGVGKPVHPEPVNASILRLRPECPIPMMCPSLDDKGKRCSLRTLGLILDNLAKSPFRTFCSAGEGVPSGEGIPSPAI